MSLRRLADQHLAEQRSRGYSPHSLEAYRRDVQQILTLLAEDRGETPTQVLVSAARPVALRRAFSRFTATHAASTVRRCWSTWNGLLSAAVRVGMLEGNPMPAVPRPSTTPREPPPLPPAGIEERLLAAAATAAARSGPSAGWPERDVALIALMAGTGLRSGEVCVLDVHDLNLAAGCLYAPARPGAAARTLALPGDLTGQLRTWLLARGGAGDGPGAESALFVRAGGERLTRHDLDRLVRRTFARAGLDLPPGTATHALRQLFALRLAARPDTTAEHLRSALGQRTATAGQAYLRRSQHRLRPSAAALSDVSTPAVSTPAVSTPAVSTAAVSTAAVSTAALPTAAWLSPALAGYPWLPGPVATLPPLSS